VQPGMPCRGQRGEHARLPSAQEGVEGLKDALVVRRFADAMQVDQAVDAFVVASGGRAQGRHGSGGGSRGAIGKSEEQMRVGERCGPSGGWVDPVIYAPTGL
jgi:hypothetical protein